MAKQEIPISESSNLKSPVFYDPDTQELTISFRSGGTYTYQGVDQNKADGFASAQSPGKYFYGFIKNQHTHTKIG